MGTSFITILILLAIWGAFKMENEFIEQIEKRTTAHYIGHLFNDKFLDIYWYLEEPEKTHSYLKTQINKEGLLRGLGMKSTKIQPGRQ